MFVYFKPNRIATSVCSIQEYLYLSFVILTKVKNVAGFVAFLVGYFCDDHHLYIFELLCFFIILVVLSLSILANTLYIHVPNVCLSRASYFCEI